MRVLRRVQGHDNRSALRRRRGCVCWLRNDNGRLSSCQTQRNQPPPTQRVRNEPNQRECSAELEEEEEEEAPTEAPRRVHTCEL